jgi:hypothetical protein
MEGQQRVDLPEQLLQAVNDLAMPWNELRPPMDVRRLVDFVLLKPPSHATRNGVSSGTRILPVAQLYERVAKQRSFRRINGGDITTDSISESHEYTSQKGQEEALDER